MPFIALLGCDGSGKSTVTQWISSVICMNAVSHYFATKQICPLLCFAFSSAFVSNLPAQAPDRVLIDWIPAVGGKPRLRFPTDQNLRYGIEKAVTSNSDGSLKWFGLSAFDGSETGITEWIDDEARTSQAFYRISQPVSLPEISTYAVFGDSRANQSGLRPSEGAVGVTYWINLALGRRLTCIENINPLNGSGPRYAFSQGGQYFDTLEEDSGPYPRVAECIAADPDLVVMYCGSNAMAAVGPLVEFDAFKRVVSRFNAAGIRLIVLNEAYYGEARSNPDYSSEIDTWNALVSTYCTTNGIPLVDTNTLLKNMIGNSRDYYFQNDGPAWVHPNVRGASEVGVTTARTIEANFTLPAYALTADILIDSPTVFPQFNNGIFGNGSKSWGISYSNSAVTTTYSPRSDGQPGNWLNLQIEDCLEGGESSTGDAGSAELYQALSGIAVPADGTYKFVAEIEILNWPEDAAPAGQANGRLIQATLSVAGGNAPPTSKAGVVTSGILFQEHTLGQRGSASPVRGSLSNRTMISSDPVIFSSAGGNTSCNVSLKFYGNMTVKISNCGLVRCN
jgi:hypothetical protein